jgi:peroxiredoxin
MRLRAGDTAPGFSLVDLTDIRHTFPDEVHDDPIALAEPRLELLVFWKHDCATCELVLPLVERAHEALGRGGLRVRGITQSAPPLAHDFAVRHDLNFTILDDSECVVSASYEIEIVPTLILTDLDGTVLSAFEGWHRGDFDELIATGARHLDVEPPALIGADEHFPEQRPGCGSRTFDPAIARRLAARHAETMLTARRIEVGDLDDEIELFFDRGLTDGLPIVPPTEGRVVRMLEGTRRDPRDLVAIMPPNLVPLTVEKVAINAVMAGCKPEYLPVVLASIEAACDERFNLHGVVATTYFPAPLMIVNGPIRTRIGMNCGPNALGQGNRANATIGRVLPLLIRNVGGGRPGEIDKCTLGHPGKYTFCFGENEEASPWPPLHVERGFAADDSTVTLYAAEAPRAVMDQASRTPESLCRSLGLALIAVMHPKLYGFVDAVLVLAPEHVRKLEGWSKDDVRRAIQEVTRRPLGELLPDERCAEGIPPKLLGVTGDVSAEMRAMPLAKFRSDDQLTIVVAGGEAGMFSAIIGGWVSGEMGSQMVTRKIEL